MIGLPVTRLSGRALDALVTAVRSTPARGVLAGILRAELGIDGLRALPQELRGTLPFSHAPLRARPPRPRESAGLGIPTPPMACSALSLCAAFRDGVMDPERVAVNALAAARRFATGVPALGPLCAYDDARALSAAKESAQRIRAGRAVGPLDGVPIAIKEEADLLGFATRMGTGYSGHPIAARDATAVARLRRAGAVILGQTPMTEFGLSPLGVNSHRNMPRNPHDTRRIAGGSSTGSAVAVALGLSPVCLGADGGGSIRVPAAYCGVFGLKPTYGRIPTTGVRPGSTSVVHLGPLGASSADLALFLEAVSGADPADPATHAAPPIAEGELADALGRGVRGLRIGVEPSEWAHASAEIQRVARAALDALEREGAVIVEVHSRLMRWATPIGYLTIGLEAAVSLASVRGRHMTELGLDTQLVLAGMDTFRPDDYVDAQRMRQALRLELSELLADVDLLALPSAAAAPVIVSDEEARRGFLDPPALNAACRYAFLANLTGLPAASAPVGFDPEGLPVGLQLIADAWDEAGLLAALGQLERSGAAVVRPPKGAIDLRLDPPSPSRSTL